MKNTEADDHQRQEFKQTKLSDDHRRRIIAFPKLIGDLAGERIDAVVFLDRFSSLAGPNLRHLPAQAVDVELITLFDFGHGLFTWSLPRRRSSKRPLTSAYGDW